MSVLSPQELQDLTHRVRPGWQRRELEHLGIPYRKRSDGSLIVFWEDVRTPHTARPVLREPQVRL